MKLRLGRRTAVIAGSSALILAGGGAAYAATSSGPVDSSGLIHGCYSSRAVNGSHAVVLQDAGTSCPRGTTAISWNQKGAASSSGAGFAYWVAFLKAGSFDYGSITVAPGGTNTATTCPNFRVLGGPDVDTVGVFGAGSECEITGLNGGILSFQMTPGSGARLDEGEPQGSEVSVRTDS